MSTEYVLQTEHLKKHFGALHAVEDISLSVKRAEIFGFLGPNGAGKTTTISMILGLTFPTAGEVEVFNQPVTPGQNRVLRRVGTMVGSPAAIIPPYTARQNLQCIAHLRPDLPSQRIDEVLKLVGLTGAADRRAGKFSTGMKQRLGLALALINKPDLLILDEPTNGMDPAGMHEVRLLLRSLAEQGTTIFLSSHLLHEMELLCDRVAIVQRGSVIVQGTVSDLLNKKEVVRIHTADIENTVNALRLLPGIHNIQVQSASIIETQGVPSEQILYHLVMKNLTPKEVMIAHADLESFFLELTQNTQETPTYSEAK